MTWWVTPWGGPEARPSLLVVLGDGELGFGEATPFPGFGDDDLARARAELEPAELPAPVDDPEAIEGLLLGFRSPSARFAVESALLDRIARKSARGLVPGRGANVPRSVLVGALEDDGFLERARAAAARGARTVKVKARGRELGEELRRLSELRSAPGPELRVRVDLNGSLDASGAREALAAYAQAAIELCEEPTSGSELLKLGCEATPWFADESALDEELFARFLAHRGCAGVILKPMFVGGVGRTLARARAVQRAGKHAVITHALDGPLALGVAAELALAVGGELAHGLDRHSGLAAFPEIELPALPAAGAPLSVVRAAHPRFVLEGPWTRSG